MKNTMKNTIAKERQRVRTITKCEKAHEALGRFKWIPWAHRWKAECQICGRDLWFDPYTMTAGGKAWTEECEG